MGKENEKKEEEGQEEAEEEKEESFIFREAAKQLGHCQD